MLTLNFADHAATSTAAEGQPGGVSMPDGHDLRGKMGPVVIVDEVAQVGNALRREFRSLGVEAVALTSTEDLDVLLTRMNPVMLIVDVWTEARQATEILAMARDRHPSIRRVLLSGSISRLKEELVSRISPVVVLRKPWARGDLERLIREG